MMAAPVQADVSACPDLPSALDRIVRRFTAASGTVHVLDSDGLLHLAASLGLSEGAQEKVRTVPVGKGMAGLAVERRQPVRSGHLPPDGSEDFFGEADSSGPHGAMALPIFRGEAVIGALGLGTAEERSFSESEVDQLMEAARTLGAKFITSWTSAA
jgi:signal transduction protein with GAF and PtsI domain